MRCFILALCATLAAAQYEGYQLLQLHPEQEWQSRVLWDLMLSDDELDFWTEPARTNKAVDVLVPPHKLTYLRQKAASLNMPVDVLDENIQIAIDEEKARLQKKTKDVDLGDFNDFDAIAAWTLDLPNSCSAPLVCTTRVLGQTFEGRDMIVFTVSAGSGKRGVWLDSAIHAREWLTPATVINIMDKVVNGYGSDAEVTDMLDKHDLHFLPVMNPDGYQYTFSNERLWRKNRADNPNSACKGTDLNRNYNYRWGMEGVSHNACSDLFCGSSGGSELETQAVQNEAARIGSTLDAWITFHSYGYMWMHPWGNTVNHAGNVCERADDHDEMYALAVLTADAIENVYNTRWARGTSCEVIYETTGGTDDYVKGVNGVKHAICPELRGIGFVINPDQIPLSVNEIWAGLVEMFRNL